MDFKINRETIPASELIYTGIQEQGIELDYILPDYCPDIFRLVKCEVCPVITDNSVNGDRLTYELQCDIKLLYCSEDGRNLQCITQRQNFSKAVELGRSPDSPDVQLSAKTDHVNFRAVNKRRLDVRGAVSVKISVTGEKSQEVISDAFGMNIQLKKIPVKYASKKLTAEKIIQLTEETELSPAQPSVTNIIRSECAVNDCEKKIISGKLLAKSEVTVKLLYSCDSSVESMDFQLPFSQIIDMEAIDETFDCTVTAEVTSCNITPSADRNGENRMLKFEPELKIRCRAVKSSEIMVVSDAYSTVYPCETEFSVIRAEQLPAVYAENFRHSAKLAEGDSVPKNIYAMWCSPKNINTRPGSDNKSVIISGMLTYSMACADSAGSISMPDRDEAFEETIEIGDEISGSFSAEITGISVSYNITSDGILNAKSDISVKISVGSSAEIKALTGIAVNDSEKKQRDGDYAIKLYFGMENEDIWDIAKRCSTEIDAVIEENELTSDRLENGGMLIIPIKE
ncbi:MAG: DUF3794 domain-containing protein [Ruminococcus flavefaciens]|nr:DUF3794 domain-containing protein [Ruminococcus flavefaciens]MCM1230429.1 DUF3794 domain-containing protein [Ruminococcus flavefaciens]